jgi:hypothetical protein
MKLNGQEREHSKTALNGYLDKVTRLWNVALILEDSREYKEAEGRLQLAKGAVREQSEKSIQTR